MDRHGNQKYSYGTEFRTVLEAGNIKFVMDNSGSAKTPMETRTKGRVYVTINDQNKVKSIAYYDKNNKRFKQIDVSGQKHHINGKPELPHTHHGYEHEEYRGARLL